MTSAAKLPLNMSDKQQMYQKKLPQIRWEHLIAGVSGGVVSTLVLHPLDLVKVRFQVNEGQKAVASTGTSSIRPQYKSVGHAFKTIFKQQGVRGLYQGVTPNVWGAGASWGLYFFFYSYFKSWLQDRTNQSTLSAGQHMFAAAEAGVTTLVITNPIWVAKTRLCLQYDQSVSASTSSKHYTGMVDCLIKTARTEGFRGLYKGFLPGVFGVSHGALQFMAYEELKKKYKAYRQMTHDAKFNSLEYITFAALSKIFAATVTYPYQVVRSRLQDQHRQYRGVTHVTMQIWSHERLAGFYKGLAPSLMRVTPACCITFLVYENMMSMLLPHHTT